MDTTFVKNASPGWKGITHVLELLKRVHYGASITERKFAFGVIIGFQKGI
jgi:hypothetical protein